MYICILYNVCKPVNQQMSRYLYIRFDSDQDGVLSVREVAMVFRSIGCSPTEAELQVHR